ncbi:MAG TPA: hypothetical protein VEC56_08575 [Candidatus Krumholzibacteria bacterium]|nr:hypothetical protein [Candidatus Krumholzibacteria bacterium]
MIRKLLFVVLAAVLAVSAVAPASAQEKRVGLGFIVGEPTGIDLKFFLNNTNALEFALAWSLSDENDLHLQGDYLWHRFDVIDLNNGDDMPLFFGIGGRVIFREDPIDDHVGIRFPVGLNYIFADYPFDIFAEIVPILDVAPDTDFDLEGAIGARFWF